MNSTTAFRLAALLGFLAVALGASGAHGPLHDIVAQNGRLEFWEKAVFYQLIHAVVLLVVASRTPMQTAGWWLIFSGVVLFSGSLYLLAFTGTSWFAHITPVGGLCLLGGWLMLALRARI